MIEILLSWILIILLLDFYMKYGKLIKKKFKKTKSHIVKKEDVFCVRNKWYWDKVIDDLEKLI